MNASLREWNSIHRSGVRTSPTHRYAVTTAVQYMKREKIWPHRDQPFADLAAQHHALRTGHRSPKLRNGGSHRPAHASLATSSSTSKATVAAQPATNRMRTVRLDAYNSENAIAKSGKKQHS